MTMLPGMGPKQGAMSVPSGANQVQFFDPKKEKEVERKRLMAKMLMTQGQTQLGKGNEIVSGIVVPKSPIEGIAGALQMGIAGMSANEANAAEDEAAAQRQRLYQEALGSTDPRMAAQILAQDPESLSAAAKLYGDALSADQASASRVSEWSREDAQRQEDAALKIKLAQMRSGGGGTYVDPDTGEVVQGYSDKPLPVGALKLQNEAVTAMGDAKAISEKANALKTQVETGQLDLGPVDNTISRLRNWAGKSTPNSQNFANMQTDLEKIRNDSLRLNKGTQTEGDAERAFAEVVKNVNDPVLFGQAMERLNAINDRAVEARKIEVNDTRANYNASPYDFDKVGALPSPVPPKGGLEVGTAKGGYVYRGGNPKDKNSWVKQ